LTQPAVSFTTGASLPLFKRYWQSASLTRYDVASATLSDYATRHCRLLSLNRSVTEFLSALTTAGYET